jgi:hypothetical protein
VAVTSSTVTAGQTLVLDGTSITVAKGWLVINSAVHNGVCVTPRAPGTVWFGHLSGTDCPAGEPGAGPPDNTLVVFASNLPGTVVGHAVVNGMSVDKMHWHLGALYGREWPTLVPGYYSASLKVGVAGVGPEASKVLSTFSPTSN